MRQQKVVPEFQMDKDKYQHTHHFQKVYQRKDNYQQPGKLKSLRTSMTNKAKST